MNRFKEPSTWAGLGVAVQMLKMFFPQHSVYIDAVSAAAGAMAMKLPERTQ